MKKILFLLLLIFLSESYGFTQGSEDREAKLLRIKRLEREILKKKAQAKLSQRIRVYSGYDSNVELTSERKNNTFEGFLYSLDFKKPVGEQLYFKADYDLDFKDYNKITDASTLLNHLKLTLANKFYFCELGLGYDLNWLYYPKNDYDFLLHKGFLYLTKEFPKKTYHRLEVYYALKDYQDRKALGDSLISSQNKTRLDRRQGARYTLTWIVKPSLALRFGFSFYTNNSNARYLDYYDYKIFGPSAYLYLKLFKNITSYWGVSYFQRDYQERTVTSANFKQKDNLYIGKTGLVYKLDRNNSLFLDYTYRENSSNDSLQEYSESLVSWGWQYRFK